MLGKLTFKKAFGIDTLRVQDAMWLLEMGDSTFEVKVAGATVGIRQGRFGVTTQEKMAISAFRYSDQRDPRGIGEIPTLDISMDVEMSLTENLVRRCSEISVANDLVDRFSEQAFGALRRFIDGYRDIQYLVSRGSSDWRDNRGLLIARMTRNEFRTYLFYVLDIGDHQFVGVFSEGRMFGGSRFDAEIVMRRQEVLERGTPLERVWVWQHGSTSTRRTVGVR